MIILAPHIDDEVIGCFTYLARLEIDKVLYFFDVDEVRKKEAHAVGKWLNFSPEFVDFNVVIDPEVKLLVPSAFDVHPHHHAVRAFAARLPNEKLYYSVDMNTRDRVTLTPDQIRQKRAILGMYKSQANLLKDDKYSFFESVRSSDVIRKIWVTATFEGMHQYKNAPDEVAFLKHLHRHIFHVKVSLEVFHNDREVEFIMFKNEIAAISKNLNHESCEMMAENILKYVEKNYPGRSCSVSVSEDNENGATVTLNYGI